MALAVMKKPYSSSSILMILSLMGFSMILCCNNSVADAFVGINWGRLSSQRLIPSMVVDLLLQNGIRDVRIFQQADNVLKAFSDSEIRVSFGIPNTVLKNYVNETVARNFLIDKVQNYHNVDVRYIMVGSEPFSTAFKNKTYDNAVDVLKLIQTQLNSLGLARIKASIPHFSDVLTLNATSKPSDADFRPDIKERMAESIRFLKENDAPFMAGMFPIHYVATNRLNSEFAFIDNKSGFVVKDVDAHIYKNAFEFLYDCYHWALAKNGGADLKIVISLVGWPTDGYPGASIANAERFYKSFLPFVTSNKGTPMRPGAPIDVYLHSLSDETLNAVQLGGFQRHWGIYNFDGQPKYKIDFSGKGRDILPSTAKGVIRMPKRWCLFNGDYKNLSKVDFEYKRACKHSDCSSLAEGGSCSHLGFKEKVSYAFNRYFQIEAQASAAANEVCNMQGLGVLVLDDPSEGSCIFPVEILSAEISVAGSTFGRFSSNGGGEGLLGSIVISARVLFLVVMVLFFR